ncbi:MAG: hypothetical protein DWQ31_06685 [Planctomycetota bacterium]|nr:MAG: hypothetical protein DWQ31_06685 [Planctomycetota bacterium]REJ90338.1 MAG: hypothetical protein DWQ35_16820 [Planctomycetota bacterium]
MNRLDNVHAPSPGCDAATPSQPIWTPAGMTIDELISSSDEQLASFDIAETHLRCAQGLPFAEGLDIPRCLQVLDDCAEIVEKETDALAYLFDETPEEFGHSRAVFCCAILSSILQEHFNIEFDFDIDFDEVDIDLFFLDSRNNFFHGILNGEHASCVPISVLYISVGRRLGYPLKLVRTEEHCFARWEDDNERFNVECSMEGFATPDDAYYREWPKKLTPQEADRLCHLRSMTPRQELAQFLYHRAHCLTRTVQVVDGVKYLLWNHDLAPDDPCFVADIDHLFELWEKQLELQTPHCFPRVDVIWPTNRRLPESVPLETERKFLRLSIWHTLLQEPRWQNAGIIASSSTVDQGPILVRCT